MSTYAGYGPPEAPKTFVLCFDGTGNKFSADSSDSNILKIFRMLDRTQRNQYHYYQPGIGTYITSADLSETGLLSKLKASYLKAKDSAVGSTFANHVLGGYKFLMRYYNSNDDIYVFGFSRGAYIARFLAEMLDFVGLLSAGNEELVQFAWKTFAKWQQRKGETEEDRQRRRRIFNYMKGFRETFSRPVKRIRFLGLFDTVNSVPRFEGPWMQRSRFPYTARSSAKVIRHAVAIDERRAKFRQDLISEMHPDKNPALREHIRFMYPRHHHYNRNKSKSNKGMRLPRITLSKTNSGQEKRNGQANLEPPRPGRGGDEDRYRAGPARRSRHSSLMVPNASTGALHDTASLAPSQSSLHLPHLSRTLSADSDDVEQDIEEVWFPGAHADIGGGWHLLEGEAFPLSHAPLVWMVKEAQRAGLQFDERKLKQFECIEQIDDEDDSPGLEVSFLSQSGNLQPPTSSADVDLPTPTQTPAGQSASSLSFHSALHLSCTSGHLHDCLAFDSGLSQFSVLMWRMMEYLPFKRMDLRPDGSWEPIRWPLPCGEVRDIPEDAHIHRSAILRMQNCPQYRPGNLIVGGGGRGIIKAPEHLGIGEWVVASDEGDPVRETYVRKRAAKSVKSFAQPSNGEKKGQRNGQQQGEKEQHIP